MELLGPCFASYIPPEYLSMLNATEFYSRVDYFIGAQFQPDQTYINIISKMIA